MNSPGGCRFLLLAALSGSPAGEKAPVPELSDQGLEETRIKGLFKEEYGKRSPADRLALAEKLLQLGKETPGDPVKRFVLYREARDLAIEAASVELPFSAIDLLFEGFRIDALAMRTEAVGKLTRTIRAPQALRMLGEKALDLTGEAIERDQYETAIGLAGKAVALAQKVPDAALLSRGKASKDLAENLQQEYSRLKGALRALEENPADPPANLAVGKFLCFIKGEWDRGLRHLVRSTDPDLKAIAEMDLSAPRTAAAQVQLGDRWAEFSSKQAGEVQDSARRRALVWYEPALSDLSGLPRAELVKKISSACFSGTTLWETRNGGAGTVLGGEAANISENFTIEFWLLTRGATCSLLTKRLKESDNCLTFILSGGCPVVIGDGSFYRVDGPSKVPVNDGKWHHLAAVKTGRHVKLFVDGKASAEMDTLAKFSSKSPWVLGRSGTHGLTATDGLYARIRLSRIARYGGPFVPRSDYSNDKDTVFFK